VAVAALIISIGAFLLAGWSAWSAHHSARSTAELVAVERARRHDETTPRIRIEDPDYNDEPDIVWLVNDGPQDLTEVRFRLTSPAGGTGAVHGLAAPGGTAQWGTTGSLGTLPQGERRGLLYHPNASRQTHTVGVEFTCLNGNAAWRVVREFDLPPEPLVG